MKPQQRTERRQSRIGSSIELRLIQARVLAVPNKIDVSCSGSPIMSEAHYTTQMKAALEAMLPDGAACEVLAIPREVYFRFEEEENLLRHAADGRKREFSGGRNCARAALEEVGYSAAPILADDDGIPLWPDGVCASLSHSQGYCAAVAGRASAYRMMGLDLEKTDRLSRSASERVVHAGEKNYVGEDQKRASLIFSIKESFFKAQFPVWRTHANFRDLELSVNPSDKVVEIRNLAEHFPSELRECASKIVMRYSFIEDFVLSLCWLKRGD